MMTMSRTAYRTNIVDEQTFTRSYSYFSTYKMQQSREPTYVKRNIKMFHNLQNCFYAKRHLLFWRRSSDKLCRRIIDTALSGQFVTFPRRSFGLCGTDLHSNINFQYYVNYYVLNIMQQKSNLFYLSLLCFVVTHNFWKKNATFLVRGQMLYTFNAYRFFSLSFGFRG